MDRTNFRRFLEICFPVILFLFLINITGYIERLLLADFSGEALAGGLNGFFLARVFQTACLAVIVVGQSFVGLYHGADQEKNIGPCIWQLIWFSVLSTLVVIPLGFSVEWILFKNTSISNSESNYFKLLCVFNFLFPLTNALSAFYFGRGILKPIVFLTLFSCILNVVLDLVLIFGWDFIPPLGTTGAALGKVISQAVLCLNLALLFLSKTNREKFGTNLWKFSPRLFWHYIRPGLHRALGAFPALGDWVLVSRFMSLKSEQHLLVFSIGSTVFYFLAFIGDGLFQTMVTVASNLMGKKEYSKLWSSFFSGFILLVVFGLCLVIPFFLFPQIITNCFRSSSFYGNLLESFGQMSPWLLLAIIAYGLNALALGLVVAARDTLFLFWFYCGMWLVSFVPIYCSMEWLHFPPETFWALVMCTNLVACSMFLWRGSKEKWQIDNWAPVN